MIDKNLQDLLDNATRTISDEGLANDVQEALFRLEEAIENNKRHLLEAEAVLDMYYRGRINGKVKEADPDTMRTLLQTMDKLRIQTRQLIADGETLMPGSMAGYEV